MGTKSSFKTCATFALCCNWHFSRHHLNCDNPLQDAHPRYAFEYSVNDPHTGDIKQQKEERDGEVVKGKGHFAFALHNKYHIVL